MGMTFETLGAVEELISMLRRNRVSRFVAGGVEVELHTSSYAPGDAPEVPAPTPSPEPVPGAPTKFDRPKVDPDLFASAGGP